MLRRIVAALLLVLAASPFTAPFAACDASVLFGQNSAPLLPASSSHAMAAEDGSHTVALSAASIRLLAKLRFLGTTATSAVAAPAIGGSSQAPFVVSASGLPFRPKLSALRI